ncbi:hypothetical protein ACFL1X_06950 [Candidatus Hydrogenedentota bacterium]
MSQNYMNGINLEKSGYEKWFDMDIDFYNPEMMDCLQPYSAAPKDCEEFYPNGKTLEGQFTVDLGEESAIWNKTWNPVDGKFRGKIWCLSSPPMDTTSNRWREQIFHRKFTEQLLNQRLQS